MMHYYDKNGYSRGEREKIFTTWGGGDYSKRRLFE